MNVLVVGAGPAGSTVAKELAMQGHSVEVLEEHEKIGRPIACTGIVTKVLFDFVKKKESYMVNELEGVRAIAPSGKEVEIPLKEYVICRERFDGFLAKEALDEGVSFSTRHKFIGLKDGKAVIRHNDEEFERDFDILIGADGPFSGVGRATGLSDGRQYYIGSQATVKGDFDPNWFLTFFGKNSPGFFGWAVPEGKNLARVGVATKKFVAKYFDILRERYNGEIVERQAGPIPIYDGARSVQKGNIFLVGDAAGVCKNTTGGGIITGIWSAKALAHCIKHNQDYSNALSPLRKELALHQRIRSMLDKFTDRDYEKLVDLMSTPKVKQILYEYPREYPSKFVWKLALAQPRLLAFAKYAFG